MGQSPDTLKIQNEIDSLIQLNRALIGKQKFSDALDVIALAKGKAIAIADTQSVRYARCLFNHGRTFDRLDRADEAENYYLASLEKLESLPENFPEDLAWSLNNLAVLYSANARFEEAEPLYFRSLELRKLTLGAEHPDYFWSLANLGDHYFKQGNYKQSEYYQIQARNLREKHLGKTHSDYAWSLNNLAVLYVRLGRYAEAETLYIEARAIREKQIGKEHPAYAVSLNNLANLYQEIQRYEEAEILYKEALEIWKKILGEKHNNVAAAIHNLATLHKKRGQHDAAVELYREALAIWEGIYGKDLPVYAQGLSSLGELREQMGDYPAALALFLEAGSIRERSLGKEHPDYGNSMNSLARVYWRMAKIKEAHAPMKDAVLLQQKMMIHAATHLSEQEQITFNTRFKEIQDQYYSFIQLNQNYLKEGIGDCLDLTLFHKGYVLFSAKQVRQRIQNSPEANKIYLQLSTLQRRLSKEYAKQFDARKDVPELENKATALEKELFIQVADMPLLQQQVTWKHVQQKLKKGEALIEFIHYNLYDPDKKDSIMYSALVLLPGMNEPALIPLFEEKELNALLEYKSERRADFVNDLYAYADRGLVKIGTPKRSLYEMIWEPLEEFGLPAVHTIYVSGTGVLHRLNMGGIPINDEQILSDKYALTSLGSTRQIVYTDTSVQLPNNPAIAVFGGIQYDTDSLLINNEMARGNSEETGQHKGNDSTSRTKESRGSNSWTYLKWTEKEASIIKNITEAASFNVNYYTGNTGTEEQFKSMGHNNTASSPAVLHVASHGFFFPDPSVSPEIPSTASVFQLADNPMIRSGLILAGGNQVWTGGQSLPGVEDGILTAYEISQLDLRNTALVVLSACETGLGDIKGNEGVYGLQRAFKIAGAKYLIMSLWQVPDRETMEFMTSFYKNWLEEKMTIPNAFRKTQREMRDRFFNPYSWAGFVLVE